MQLYTVQSVQSETSLMQKSTDFMDFLTRQAVRDFTDAKNYWVAAGNYRLAPKWLQTKWEGREEGGSVEKATSSAIIVRFHRPRSVSEDEVHGIDPPARLPLPEGVTNGAGHNYILFFLRFL